MPSAPPLNLQSVGISPLWSAPMSSLERFEVFQEGEGDRSGNRVAHLGRERRLLFNKVSIVRIFVVTLDVIESLVSERYSNSPTGSFSDMLHPY